MPRTVDCTEESWCKTWQGMMRERVVKILTTKNIRGHRVRRWGTAVDGTDTRISVGFYAGHVDIMPAMGNEDIMKAKWHVLSELEFVLKKKESKDKRRCR